MLAPHPSRKPAILCLHKMSGSGRVPGHVEAARPAENVYCATDTPAHVMISCHAPFLFLRV
ncbi:hypothetical protein BJV74DRAFT_873780 [Russula compacta]|nr:hypothetical protein BJV74DRAFT_873780 [Russula compacta]